MYYNFVFLYIVIEKYKAIIKDEFFPNRGFGRAKLSVAKKAISDFKKICQTKALVADLMLYYVEIGVRFTREYGDIDEPFYNSMEGMYEKVMNYIAENELQEAFKDRCRKVVVNTSNIGWGFHDTLSDIYEEHFNS